MLDIVLPYETESTKSHGYIDRALIRFAKVFLFQIPLLYFDPALSLSERFIDLRRIYVFHYVTRTSFSVFIA